MRILMIEDNKSVSEMMQMFFLNESWEATFKDDGKEGLATFLAQPDYWDMITLDLNLPGLDGVSVCREIRKVSSKVPIIMLTARDSESDQVIGLEMGADDYVTKPFSPLTLIARMKALYRRTHQEDLTVNHIDQQEDIQTKYFYMNLTTREVMFNGTPILGLTPKEFDLLYVLASHPKQVFSREKLLELVWEYQYFGDERTVDAHIKKLRQKLNDIGPEVIQTVWGVGYKFDDSGVKV